MHPENCPCCHCDAGRIGFWEGLGWCVLSVVFGLAAFGVLSVVLQ